MIQVLATRIRENRPRRAKAAAMGLGPLKDDAFVEGAYVRGIALREPCVGQEWVIYFEGANRRIVTSRVQRVLRSDDEGAYYVETRNSVYRLFVI